MVFSSPIGLRWTAIGAVLILVSLSLSSPARSQDTTARIPRASTDLGAAETVDEPARLLQESLSGRFEIQRIQPNLFRVHPEVLRQLRENPNLESGAPDSTRIYTATLSGGVRKISVEHIPTGPARSPAAAPASPGPETEEEVAERRARRRASEEPARAPGADDRAQPSPPDRPGPTTPRDRYVLPVEAIAVRGNRVSGYYRPFIEAPTGGLALSPENERFRGSLYVGVWDTLNPTSREDLPSPIAFQITAEGAEVEPAQLSVRHTHIPLQEVRIQTRELRDSVRLTVWTSLTASGIDVPLEVSRPDLTVRPTPSRRIPGFGLGTARLSVELGRLGGGATTVDLRAQRGRPRPQQMRLAGSGTGFAEIRSSYVGTDTVTVSAPGFASGSTVLRYGFPWSFLLATLLGGVLGASLQHLRRRQQPGDTRGLVRQLTGGTITALIVGIASTVGVNFLPLTFSAQYGEALFFTIAAVSAYLWETLEFGSGVG